MLFYIQDPNIAKFNYHLNYHSTPNLLYQRLGVKKKEILFKHCVENLSVDGMVTTM